MTTAIRMTNVAQLFSEGVEADRSVSPVSLRARRDALFAETPSARVRRLVRVAAALAAPRRLVGLAGAVDLILRDRAVGAATLPDPAAATTRPDGLCGAVGDLSPATLMEGYALGLHVRAPAGPATWWSPAARRVRRVGSQTPRGRMVFDRDCDAVVERCARAAADEDPLDAPRPALKHAHARLVDLGLAHGFAMAGQGGPQSAGGYGVSIGKVFVVLGCFGESRARSDALDGLDRELARRGYETLDLTFARCPDATGETLARADYAAMLATNPNGERPGRWRADPRPAASPRPALRVAA